jgi:hypothetical protein
MKTFGMDKKFEPINFTEVSAEELEVISGGSGGTTAGNIAMVLAGGWAGAVAGAAVGGLVGAAAGFALGSLIGIGYVLATSGGPGASQAAGA